MKQRKKLSGFYKQLTWLVLPIAFQQFMLALVGASDAVMLGNVAQSALSAVSLANQVTFVYQLFLAAITIGANILAAQYWGKQDSVSVEKVLGIVLRISAVVSVVFCAAAFLFPAALMHIFTADAVLKAYGITYLKIAGFSYLFCSVSQVCLCIMKNSGHAVESTVISSVTVVLNIVLNAVFIFGWWKVPALGVAGAAIATTLSRAAEMIWTVIACSRKEHIPIRFRRIRRPERELQKDFWKYTYPVLGNELVWGVGFTMYSVIMGHLGSDAAAANSMAGIVKNLIACFCIGLGSGGGILVGNELGASRFEQAKTYGGLLCKMAVIGGMASGMVILVLTPLILRTVQLTQVSEGYLKWMLCLCACFIVGKSVNSTVIGGIFCAGGDSRFGFLCDAVTMWCVTVPLGMLAAFVWKWPVPFVYLAVNLDEMIKLPFVYRHYKKYQWIRNITNQKGEETT